MGRLRAAITPYPRWFFDISDLLPQPSGTIGNLEGVLLSDKDIKAEIESGRVGIDPYEPAMVQPSSIDGLTITELPAAIAIGKNHIGTMAGKLNGEIIPTTPSGWRML